MTEQRPEAGARPSFLTTVVWCILFTETAERFSYFGFRAILVLYFTNALGYDDSTAIALFAYLASLAYFSPLLGALLADGRLGHYRTILWFGLLYALGLAIHTVGAFIPDNIGWKRACTFVGLFLVCIGTGGIKPCVSSFGADQVANKPHTEVNSCTSEMDTRTLDAPGPTEDGAKSGGEEGPKTALLEHRGLLPENTTAPADPQDADQVRAFFAYFYFCINLGAVTSIFFVPILKFYFGFGAAFLAPTILLLLALAAFISKRKEYVHHVPKEGSASLANTFRLCGWLLRQRLEKNYPRLSRVIPAFGGHSHVLLRNEDDDESEQATISSVQEQIPTLAESETEQCKGDSSASPFHASRQQLADASQALHTLPILALLPIFWTLYDQQGSVWTLQATRMKLHGLQPEQLNIVNPIEIMIFIPLFDRCIYPALEARGYNISHLRRMGCGMLLCAVSFTVSGFLESVIQAREQEGEDNKVDIFWQLPQITILAVAEILLSVTGYDFAYSNSPVSMKAFLMAVYLLTTAVGDFFGGILYSSVFQSLNRATAMHICALLMLGNLGLFGIVARWWESCETEEVQKKEKSTIANNGDDTHALFENDEEVYSNPGRTSPLNEIELSNTKKEAMIA